MRTHRARQDDADEWRQTRATRIDRRQRSRFHRRHHGTGNASFGNLDTCTGIDVPHRLLHKLYQKIYALARHGRYAEAE